MITLATAALNAEPRARTIPNKSLPPVWRQAGASKLTPASPNSKAAALLRLIRSPRKSAASTMMISGPAILPSTAARPAPM